MRTKSPAKQQAVAELRAALEGVKRLHGADGCSTGEIAEHIKRHTKKNRNVIERAQARHDRYTFDKALQEEIRSIAKTKIEKNGVTLAAMYHIKSKPEGEQQLEFWVDIAACVENKDRAPLVALVRNQWKRRDELDQSAHDICTLWENTHGEPLLPGLEA